MAKMRKIPNFPGLRIEISPVSPKALEHLRLHFSDDQFAPLIPKISNKI